MLSLDQLKEKALEIVRKQFTGVAVLVSIEKGNKNEIWVSFTEDDSGDPYVIVKEGVLIHFSRHQGGLAFVDVLLF